MTFSKKEELCSSLRNWVKNLQDLNVWHLPRGLYIVQTLKNLLQVLIELVNNLNQGDYNSNIDVSLIHNIKLALRQTVCVCVCGGGTRRGR